MRLLLALLVGLQGCVTVENLPAQLLCGPGNKDKPPGLTYQQCIDIANDPDTKVCLRDWKDFASLDECKLYHSAEDARACWQHRKDESAFKDCLLVENSPEERYCRQNSKIFANREQCAEAYKDPQAYNCRNESNYYGSDYYECMRYHDDKRERAVVREERRQEREQAKRDAEEAEAAERRAEMIRGLGKALGDTEKKSTNCVTEKQFGKIVTNCDSH